MDALAAAQQGALLEQLSRGYAVLRQTTYMSAAAYALVAVDYLQTLPDEIRLIWPTPLSVPKVLFLGTRYYFFAHIIISILHEYPTDLSPEQCKRSFDRLGISCAVAVAAAEAILFLRVYAFSGRNKKMLAWLVFQFVVHNTGAFFLVIRFLSTVKFVQMPFHNVHCLPFDFGTTALLGGTFSLIFATALMMMLIMLYITFRKHRRMGESALLTMFYRDGVIHFIVLAALASVNVFATLIASKGYKVFVVQMGVTLHVILSTRMLLHLHSWAECDEPIILESGKITKGGAEARQLGDLEYSCGNYCSQRPPTPMEFEEREVASPPKKLNRPAGQETPGCFLTQGEPNYFWPVCEEMRAK